jgi:hypothetical protein
MIGSCVVFFFFGGGAVSIEEAAVLLLLGGKTSAVSLQEKSRSDSWLCIADLCFVEGGEGGEEGRKVRNRRDGRGIVIKRRSTTAVGESRNAEGGGGIKGIYSST